MPQLSQDFEAQEMQPANLFLRTFPFRSGKR